MENSAEPEIKIPEFLRRNNTVPYDRVPEEEIEEEKSKKAKSVLKKVLIGAGAEVVFGAIIVGGFLYYKKTNLSNEESKRVNSLINAYKSESVCILPESLYTPSKIDFEFCDGETLENILVKNNVETFIVDNSIYSSTGENIVKVDAMVENSDFKELSSFDTKDYEIKTIPNGYTKNGNYATKTSTERRTLYLKEQENSNYIGFETEDGYHISDIISVETLSTYDYEALKAQDLIVDLPDNIIDGEEYNTGSFKLIKK